MLKFFLSSLLILLLFSASIKGSDLLFAPLVLEGETIGVVEVNSYVKEEIQLKCGDFLSNVTAKVKKSTKKTFMDVCYQKKTLSLMKMEELGVTSQVVDFQIILSINNEIKKTNLISDLKTVDLNYNNDQMSGYFNYYYSLKNEFDFKSDLSQSLNFDLNQQFSGFVFESEGSVSYAQSFNSEIYNVSLTKDFVEQKIRVQGGDVSFGGYGLGRNGNLMGLALKKDDSLMGRHSNRLTGSSRFFLPQESYVSIYINGAFFKKVLLPSGNHEISDLGLNTGMNEVRLEIEDVHSLAKVTQRFFLQASPDLLKKGETQYELAFGENERIGQSNLFSFFKYGWLESFSLEWSGFFTDDESEWALGAVSSNWAGISRLSYHKSSESRLSLDHFVPKKKIADFIGELGFSLRWNNFDELYYFVTYSQSLFDDVSLFFSYQEKEDEKVFESYLSTNLTRSILLGAQYKNGEGEDSFWEASFFLNINLDKLNSNWSKALHQSSENFSVSVQYDKTNVNFAGAHANGEKAYSARIQKEYPQKEVYLTHETRLGATDRFLNEFGFNSAFSWTSDSFALSLPIYESFVLFKNNKGASYGAEINGREVKSEDYWGPVVLHNISSYHKTPLHILAELESLDQSMTLSEDMAYLSYKSGKRVRLLVEKSLMVTGRLLDGDSSGKTLSFLFFKLENKKGKVVKEGFTDEVGDFFLSGIKEGEYSLSLGDGWKKVNLKIKDLSHEEEGYLVYGDISMERD